MSPTASPAFDAELPDLLRRLLDRFTAGDGDGLRAGLQALGTERCNEAPTLIGALCLGGCAFAMRIAAHAQPDAGTEDLGAKLIDAFCTAIAAPDDSPPDHEQRVAERLVAAFALDVPAASLLDTLRADLLIAAGPLEEVPQAALAAMRHRQWATALRGFDRLRDSVPSGAPANTDGLAAVCLHQLGRYAEAEACAQAGLGPQRERMAIPPVRTESELIHRWSGRRLPVVSIVCTTYNHERYIESALRGFLSQDCPYPFEILIHDDASTDGTQGLIRQWQARYPQIIKPVLQAQNQFSRGVRPFELLLARAKGEFVATCEGDDFWIDATKLTQQVGFLKSHPEYSCSAHNYLHYTEAALTVQPWIRSRKNFDLSRRQLAGLRRLLWLPTLVFRKTFSTLPPERADAAFGDQFLTSFLGTFGRCMYFEALIGAVRRENEFSSWSPLPEVAKERMRVKTWLALIRMHTRLGNPDAVSDLMAKIDASTLDPAEKSVLLGRGPNTGVLEAA